MELLNVILLIFIISCAVAVSVTLSSNVVEML